MLELICKELGVTIGEKWLGNDGCEYKITPNGVLIYIEYNTNPKVDIDYFETIDNISRVLIGELKPVWKPKEGERYFCPRTDMSFLNTNERWGDTTTDNYRLESNLVFKTKEEAIETANKMLEVLKHEL